MEERASTAHDTASCSDGCAIARVGGCTVIGDRAAVSIRRYPAGPTLVRGATHLVDAEGRAVPVTRRTVAVCVCGASRLGVLCDGTHRFALRAVTPSNAARPR